MKWLDIKKAGTLAAALLLSTASFAQDKVTDSIAALDSDKVAVTDSVTVAVKDYRSGWGKLIPKYIKVQYAGSMGFMSLGGGYDYGVNRQWETDIFFGFLPHYSTAKNKITLTLKQNYIPWKTDINDRFMIELLTTGLYINTIFDDEFWISEPDKYPNGYYSFSTRIRFNAFVGQRLTYKLKPESHKFLKSVTAFYEVSTNDVYVLSAFNNSYLKPKDYLVLSLGVKLQMF
ncbi:hypothetical protein R1T16_12800 [Flavobacterium sp. DG1-102-2]|uniref:hypothetical protein n=1 Tax=Flavobacterium sp. DG1-102-2 TaxID=3081663 RepID=UPI002949EEB3|nr:hypothetical protein [Flavobacterium sp. DG1-102-2]MDV6169307.1 hypothetical protein [Flavobacterium sp. DG1-102-2]